MGEPQKIILPMDIIQKLDKISKTVITYQSLVDGVYRNTKTVVIHNDDNSRIWIVPFNEMCGELVPITAIMANGYYMMDTQKSFGELEFTAITQSYWTCSCKNHFTHHKIVNSCNKCGCTVEEDTRKLPYINELIKWDLLVP